MLVLDLERQIVDRAPNDPFQDFNIPGFPTDENHRVGSDFAIRLKKLLDDDRIMVFT
jgi:protease IV